MPKIHKEYVVVEPNGNVITVTTYNRGDDQVSIDVQGNWLTFSEDCISVNKSSLKELIKVFKRILK